MFYDIYCDLCRQKGLTPSGAAGKIGFNRASITVWKNSGKAPKQDLLLKIAAFFGVTVDYLLEKETAPAQFGRHRVDLSDVDFAFYGQFSELSEDDKETIMDMVRIMRQRRNREETK